MKFYKAILLLLSLGLGMDLAIWAYDGYFHLVALPWFAAIAGVALIVNTIGFWMGKIKKFWW